MSQNTLPNLRVQSLVLDGHRPFNLTRALPYQFARSALFSGLPANLKNRMVYTDEQEIAHTKGFRIFQRTGKQLTQSEETLWLEIVHLALKMPQNEVESPTTRVEVKFSLNAMLKILEKGVDSKNRAALRNSLNLLGDVRIRVEYEDVTEKLKEVRNWTANLIDIASLSSGQGGLIAVYVDRILLRCFKGGYTIQNREQRNKLKDSPLAQWMHGYYATHRQPLPIPMQSIKKFSGCNQLNPEAWEIKFKQAVSRLAEVTKWECRYNSESGFLSVTRNTTAAKRLEQPSTPNRG